MAMAMALRKHSNSVNKTIRNAFNGGSLYYMVCSLSLSLSLSLCACVCWILLVDCMTLVLLLSDQSSLPNEAVYDREKRVSVRISRLFTFQFPIIDRIDFSKLWTNWKFRSGRSNWMLRLRLSILRLLTLSSSKRPDNGRSLLNCTEHSLYL